MEKYVNLKPREKMLYQSVKTLTDEELIQVLLNTGTKDIPVEELSKNLLSYLDHKLYALENLRPEELYPLRGISKSKACLLIASAELGVRVARARAEAKRIILTNPDSVKDLFYPEMRSLPHEEFHIVFLNQRMEVIGREKTSSGDFRSASADPAKIFSTPIKRGVKNILIAHNHPSGDPTPSDTDIATTKNLVASGNILGIKVLDHIIVSASSCYSFHENGQI